MAVKLRENLVKRAGVFLPGYLSGQKRGGMNLSISTLTRRSLLKKTKRRDELLWRSETKREHELIVEDNGMIGKKKKQADFIPRFKIRHLLISIFSCPSTVLDTLSCYRMSQNHIRNLLVVGSALNLTTRCYSLR